jgi:L-fuconolactonase
MSDLYQPTAMVDTHQHLWKPSERRYAWLDLAGPPLDADFGPELVEADVAAAGITATVLVQAADTYEDTFYMLSVAARAPVVKGVVAWAPLDRVEESRAALELYARTPLVRGIRVLNHNYDDPRWLLGDDVGKSIDVLVPLGLTLDAVSVIPEHLQMVNELAGRHPELTIIVDHLGGPKIAAGEWEPWASLLAKVATHPNVHIKISGLSTSSSPEWTSGEWQRYVDHAVTQFGSSRVMLGSDWPVATLAGDFQRIWLAQREVISHFSESQQDDMLHGTAERIYSLDLS